MSYPSTVDTGQISPWALYTGELLQGAAVLTANTAYFVGVTLNATSTLIKLRARFGTGGAGHYDLGIYDSGGNRLASAGSTVTATGVQTFTLGTSLVLSPANYWLAFWIDNATDTVSTVSITVANLAPVQNLSTASALPATMTGAVNGNTKPSLVALFQGGWS